MTGWIRALTTSGLAVVVVSAVVAQESRPTFRSGAGIVRVDVAVELGGRPATNLAAGDFDLLDEGVSQAVTDLSYGKLPIDVTVAFDVSKSVTGQLITALRRSVDDLQSRLREGDRLKVITFNQRVKRILDYTSRAADTKTAFDGLSGSGGTALLDALAVAMASAAPLDHRQLVILFSDGLDTSSVADPAGLVDLARHTTPTVAFVGPFDAMNRGPQLPRNMAVEISGGTSAFIGIPTPNRQALGLVPGRPDSRQDLNAQGSTLYTRLAAETGGVVLSLPATFGANLQGTFGRVLDDFRSSYVLYFSPQATAKPGFHVLEVKVKRPGPFEVRARRGYVKE